MEGYVSRKPGRAKRSWRRLIFAGTEKDDDSKLTVIIDFDSVEAMKAFGGHEELKAKRAAAGAILETTVITVMSEESFTG